MNFLTREPVLLALGALALLDALIAGADLRQAALIAVAAVIRSRVSPVEKQEVET